MCSQDEKEIKSTLGSLETVAETFGRNLETHIPEGLEPRRAPP